MKIKQFKDEPLSHYSYAIVSGTEMAVIDPSRNPLPYYQFAEDEGVKIIAIFETHPHADFVSGHLQMHKETEATIYVSEKVGAHYPHEAFDEGDDIQIGKITLQPIFTPGHSPDSLSFHAHEENEHAVFTGDALFIGDVGRPDLREKSGNTKSKSEDLAKMMYETMQHKYNYLPDHTLVYPAHGAGSLCGSGMSKADSSTLGKERQSNWALQGQTEKEFVEKILSEELFIPSYFGYNVDLNIEGAETLRRSKHHISIHLNASEAKDDKIVVDTRDEAAFKKGHLNRSVNIMARSDSDKFETWLGAIVKPEEEFHLIIASINDLEKILDRTAKLGYEKQVKSISTVGTELDESSASFSLEKFKENQEDYTIVDIRNKGEVKEGKFFENAHSIPLNELRERAEELPKNKPFVVHCAGGYRSAAGSSILASKLPEATVYDLSDDVQKFK